jgi:hypothetical protein
MKFYRVSKSTDGGNSAGFEFFTAKSDAEKEMRQFLRDDPTEFSRIDVIEITPTRTGILRALKLYASHADNG